ncbi:MAG: hypothetical protein E5X35_11650 [Mesorhizobium sp.]|uniref:hypothetical protein n=1 Tax=unclassified Mesorhizobium TaxID=325217 RepID=UPI000FCBAEFE|nr:MULTISPECIES: hypothetical protein [unclassified Mesorhizobium]RUV65197.1 hypothetical protein EOA85_00090 [Mesorhizobium sp. M5C.F.Ca.IN.020.29.1.1]TIM87637.1 MAG: hypothetical protein E5Y50_11415 [Mesorhizobium sp.]TIR33312.1 MAG: hypothetical protein E5X35_11650 [Mesorhizobium sp.]
MSAIAAQVALLAETLAKCAAPSINIAPSVIDFGQQKAERLAALARAAGKISTSVHGGNRYAQMLDPGDFAVLKAFVAYADGEFALSQVTRRDDLVDFQHSPDGYSDYRDREKL